MYTSMKEFRQELMLAKKTDTKRANVLTMVLAKTLSIAKDDNNREANAEDIKAAIKKLIKEAGQSLEFGVEGAEYELEILTDMAPKAMTKEEIEVHVNAVKEKHSSKGDIMKALKVIEGMDMKVASKMI